MSETSKNIRIFATCDIGSDALDLLRRRGHQVEAYSQLEPPPTSLILGKVR